jgi:hypothetical protein
VVRNVLASKLKFLQELQSPIPAAGADTPSVDRERPNRYPDSTLRDPNYTPSRSPQSRRELAATPHASPVTRSRARLQQLRDMNNPPEGRNVENDT